MLTDIDTAMSFSACFAIVLNLADDVKRSESRVLPCSATAALASLCSLQGILST